MTDLEILEALDQMFSLYFEIKKEISERVLKKNPLIWQQYAREGKKIGAIRYYQTANQTGLMEAKQAVETWMMDNLHTE